MPGREEFMLKWNEHQSNFISIFEDLCNSEQLVDVTLACEDRSFTAHKLVLSACSPYFRRLFTKNTCKHPIVFLKDTKSEYVEVLLRFMYRGEISIHQEDLMPLIQTAKSLRIKGLTDVATASEKEDIYSKTGSQSASSEDTTPPAKKRKSSLASGGSYTVHPLQTETSRDVQPPPPAKTYSAAAAPGESHTAQLTSSEIHPTPVQSIGFNPSILPLQQNTGHTSTSRLPQQNTGHTANTVRSPQQNTVHTPSTSQSPQLSTGLTSASQSPQQGIGHTTKPTSHSPKMITPDVGISPDVQSTGKVIVKKEKTEETEKECCMIAEKSSRQFGDTNQDLRVHGDLARMNTTLGALTASQEAKDEMRLKDRFSSSPHLAALAQLSQSLSIYPKTWLNPE